MTNYAKARTHMVDSQIHTAGVVDPGILEAFSRIPREAFVAEGVRGIAYSDEHTAMGEGRYLLDPMTHARMVQALQPRPEEVVLDVGTGSGYSAAVFSPLVSTVIALDSDQALLERAASAWAENDLCNIASFVGNLPQGNPQNAPYNIIFIGGAIAEVPDSLKGQLAPEGRLIAIVKDAGEPVGRVSLTQRVGENQYSSYTLFNACAPYLPGFEPVTKFEF